MQSKFLSDFSGIKLILLDLEGVLVNPDEAVDNVIPLMKNFVKELKAIDCRAGIITAGKNGIVESLKLIEGLIVLSSGLNKLSAADKLLSELNLTYEQVFYMGDEVLDLPLLAKCGISAAPKSARREVKRNVKLIIESTDLKMLLETILNYKKGIFVE